MVKEHLHYFGGQKVFFCKKVQEGSLESFDHEKVKKVTSKVFQTKESKALDENMRTWCFVLKGKCVFE